MVYELMSDSNIMFSFCLQASPGSLFWFPAQGALSTGVESLCNSESNVDGSTNVGSLGVARVGNGSLSSDGSSECGVDRTALSSF